MATNFQSSFIPKESISVKTNSVGDKGIINFLGVLLLIISIGISIALFFYKVMLQNDIENLKSELAIAESSIDRQAVDKIIIFNKKLNLIREILGRHQASSNFLTLLSSSTVSSVQFKDLKYTYLSAGGLDVILRGESASYSALALQENEFKKVKEIKSFVFSNLSLLDSGKVGFDLVISMDPTISIYNPKITDEVSITTNSDTSQDIIFEDFKDVELIDLDNI